jgi:tetratricopeptide (TPR) repeat protein
MTGRQTLAELLGLKSTRVEMLRFLGESAYLWLYLGQPERALAIFEALTVLAPQDPVGHLGCAEVMMERGEFKAAERAAAQAGKSANVARAQLALAHTVRGRALLEQKRPKEAEKAWRKACDVDPQAGESMAGGRIELARICGILPRQDSAQVNKRTMTAPAPKPAPQMPRQMPPL